MNDDDLLDLLRGALIADPVEPDRDAIVFLHRALDAHKKPGRRRSYRIVASCLAGVGVMAGAGGAYALSGAVLPEPVRVVAHAVGLPVDSPEVAEARAARRALRQSLKREDANATAAAAQRLRDALGGLSSSDRAELGDVVGLLHEADEQHASSGQTNGNEPAPGSSTTSEQETTTTSALESPSTSNAVNEQPTVVAEPTTTTSTTENPGDTATSTTLGPDSSGVTTASGAQVNP
jgi:hypothetical protein